MSQITLLGGKYTVIDNLFEGGGFQALRYGEEWCSLAGDKLAYTMFCEIEELRTKTEELGKETDEWRARCFELEIDAKDRDIVPEVEEPRNGGGLCPSCSVYLVGKARYCGKCGQRIGWFLYEGGNR